MALRWFNCIGFAMLVEGYNTTSERVVRFRSDL